MLRDEKQILWKFSAIFLGVALPMQLFGPAMVGILLALGCICGLLATKGESLRSSVKILMTAKLTKLWLAMLAAFLISTVMSIDVALSMNKFIQIIGISILGMAIFLTYREMPSQKVQLSFQSFCLAITGILFLVTIEAGIDYPRLSQAIHGDKWDSINRLNHMSSIFAVLLPFLWAWLIQQYRERNLLAKGLALPISILSFITLIVCGGRSGWIAGLITTVVFLIIASRKHDLIIHRRHYLYGIVALIASPFVYVRSHHMSQAALDRLSFFTGNTESSGRNEVWEFAISHIWDNPITGIGVNAYRSLPEPTNIQNVEAFSMAHPHNAVLQIFLETGILGFIATAVFIVFALFKMWKISSDNLYGLAGFCSLLAFSVSSLFFVSIFNMWWLTFAIFCSILSYRIGWSSKTSQN